MCEIARVQDLEDYANKILPKSTADFIRGGAGSEKTLKNNKQIYLRYRLRPRYLTGLSLTRNLSTTVLGKTISMPIGIAPISLQKLVHPNGECDTARAAQEMKTIFILSTASTSSIEEVATAAPMATKWLQLYIYKDRDIVHNLIKRAENSGYEALVLTTDNKVQGNRRSDERNNFVIPSLLRYANFEKYKEIQSASKQNVAAYVKNQFDASFEWNDIKWLQSITHLPIILKGILTAEDALLGAEMGISAIYVSNHGGRQLDTVPATLEALPEIVRAVGGKLEIYLDGGIRTGVDVFKALALGVQVVFVARPVVWSLACTGKDGVQKMLKILKAELRETLRLTGCSSIQHIERNMVAHENYYAHL